MSGLELPAKLNAESCGIPVIFHGGAKMRIQAMCYGAVEFFTEPFDNEVLLANVRIALNGRLES